MIGDLGQLRSGVGVVLPDVDMTTRFERLTCVYMVGLGNVGLKCHMAGTAVECSKRPAGSTDATEA